jgi:ParB-like chromosome segregation protein Spo0J
MTVKILMETKKEGINFMEVELVDVAILNKPAWHATHVLRPDLLVLSGSLADYGFMSPIIVQKSTNTIIDGYHRWMLVKDNKHMKAKFNGLVPVVFVDCDLLEARVMHMRLNRGRGALVAHKVSDIVRELIASGAYDEQDFDRLLSMKYDELEVLIDGTILKRKKIAEHKYSRAWVPIEAPAGTVDSPVIEGPPNSDR